MNRHLFIILGNILRANIHLISLISYFNSSLAFFLVDLISFRLDNPYLPYIATCVLITTCMLTNDTREF